ncbi:caspase family protein [Rubrivivax sp. JA1024]|nr:caspase family protein [Rubrivivax sp. JA1024]
MAQRALCVGINQFRRYLQFQLNGCVNDARDMGEQPRRRVGTLSPAGCRTPGHALAAPASR